MKHFPDRFLFGAATSAHQVEGNNIHSDWWEWEQIQHQKLNISAEGVLQRRIRLRRRSASGGKNQKFERSGIACNHWNRFREDFTLAKELGHNAHRFSIEWSRIEPNEGEWDERAIDHYREVLEALRNRDMTPMVTLHHFTNPRWFARAGGWEHAQSPKFFARYVEKAVVVFGDLVTLWVTINEPSILIHKAYLETRWPPGKRSLLSALRVFRNLLSGHRAAVTIIRKYAQQDTSRHVRCGPALLLTAFEPHNAASLPDRFSARVARFLANDLWLKYFAQDADFIGVNYYHHTRLAFSPMWPSGWVRNANEKVSDIGWELYPSGILHVLRTLERFRKPIYITENGLADAKDQYRAWFITEHLRSILLALEEGIDVRGYFHWSLLDNFEWEKGFAPRFGLIEVEYATQRRTPRPSSAVFRRIIREGIK